MYVHCSIPIEIFIFYFMYVFVPKIRRKQNHAKCQNDTFRYLDRCMCARVEFRFAFGEYAFISHFRWLIK